MARIYALFVVVILHGVNGSFQESAFKNLQRDSRDLRIGNMKHRHGYRLDVMPQASFVLQNEIKCITSCVASDGCVSVNVRKQSDEKVLCELLPFTEFQYPSNLTQDKDTTHWFPKDASTCVPNPCGQSGACETKDSVSAPFTCVCGADAITGKLCDIYDPNHNFALLKPTAQSTTRVTTSGLVFSSKYAVDGIKADSCSGTGVATCAHVHYAHDQWWRVDLQLVIPVARIAITNRKNYKNTLLDFEIKIGNSLNDEGRANPKCGDRHSITLRGTTSITCSQPLKGRYVVIQSFYSDPIVLTEVEVFAGP